MAMHPAFSGGGGRLRWARAANSEPRLRAALGDPAVDAVEADVCTLPSGGGGSNAYIVHPPSGERWRRVKSHISISFEFRQTIFICSEIKQRSSLKNSGVVSQRNFKSILTSVLYKGLLNSVLF